MRRLQRRGSHGWAEDGEEPDPRWSLANERTFLAYNRTALALVVAGLAAAGSRGVLDGPGVLPVLGVLLIALGTGVALASRPRLLEVQRAMRLGEPLPPPHLGRLVPGAIALIGGVAAVAAVTWR